jgi:hypothetical protein
MRGVLQTTGSLLLPFEPALAARLAAELRRASSAFAAFVAAAFVVRVVIVVVGGALGSEEGVEVAFVSPLRVECKSLAARYSGIHF